MNNSPKKLKSSSRVLLVVCFLALVISIFVPLWRIELDAPQYPEGLELLIYPDKLGGNVDIINGLNHYIGMRTLHSEEFVEFTVLPYIIGAFALFSLFTAIAGSRKMLYTLLVAFVLFGIIAMVDFYRWEYDYGHNLDPHAAIIVPGMAYQPPLIGFKQLLNFGAYSIPALGGWLFIASGVLMVVSVLSETRVLSRFTKRNRTAKVALMLIPLLSACGGTEPEPIKVNRDNCAYCNMTISDPRFAAQLVTKKGRVYKFDDLSCLEQYIHENRQKESEYFVADYEMPAKFLRAEEAFFVSGEMVSSPMGGNIAAFSNKTNATRFALEIGGEPVEWKLPQPQGK